MVPSPRSLSEVRFGALLTYSPDGTSEASRKSVRAVADIKNCLPAHILRIGERFEEAFRGGMFGDFLGDNVLLVPVPRSAPFKTKDVAWPALEICNALATRRLCAGVDRLLERHTAVKKSAWLRKGAERPGPDQHEATIRCASSSFLRRTVVCRRLKPRTIHTQMNGSMFMAMKTGSPANGATGPAAA